MSKKVPALLRNFPTTRDVPNANWYVLQSSVDGEGVEVSKFPHLEAAQRHLILSMNDHPYATFDLRIGQLDEETMVPDPENWELVATFQFIPSVFDPSVGQVLQMTQSWVDIAARAKEVL